MSVLPLKYSWCEKSSHTDRLTERLTETLLAHKVFFCCHFPCFVYAFISLLGLIKIINNKVDYTINDDEVVLLLLLAFINNLVFSVIASYPQHPLALVFPHSSSLAIFKSLSLLEVPVD